MIKSLLFLVGPLLCFGLGAFFYLRRKKLVDQGNKVEGEIIRFEGIGKSRLPIVEYTSVTGQKILKKSQTGLGAKAKKGDRVVVYHDSNDVSIFLIENWITKWLPLFLIGFSIIITFLYYTVVPKLK